MKKGKKRSIVAIVPAAGFGNRFGKERNKPLYVLNGKPMVAWVLETLEGIDEIDEIVPVFKEEDLLSGAELIEEFNISKARRIVCGGKERQDSVNNAVMSLDDTTSIVVIHDGARPLADRELFRTSIRNLNGFDGLTAGVPVKDTIKECAGTVPDLRTLRNKVVSPVIVKKTLGRDVLWSIQTPQVFDFKTLKDAYEKAYTEGFYATDDAALIERYGGNVRIIEGSYRNIKVTTPDDIIIAEALLSATHE